MRFRFLERLLPSGRSQRQLGNVGSTAISWIRYPFHLIFGLGVVIGHMVASWWDSRNLRYLLQGLPAFILAIALLVVGSMVFFQDRSALAQEYQAGGARAMAEAMQRIRAGQDPKAAIATAQTCYKRLSLRDMAPTPENTFHMAETYVYQRQPQAAESIFQALAPLDPKKPQYGPAHFEIAQRLIPPINPNPKNEQLKEAEYRLARAIAYPDPPGGIPYSAFARALMFELLRNINRPDEAEHELVMAVKVIGDQRPQLRVKLAQWYWQTQKRDLAEKQLEAAIASLDSKVEDNIDDNESRFLLIQCLVLDGRLKSVRNEFKRAKEEFVRAKELCDRGRAVNQDNGVLEKYKAVRYNLLLAQYDSFIGDPNRVMSEQFELLEQALFLFPNDIQVLQKLVTFIRMPGPEGKKAKQAFDDLLIQGASSVIAHIVMGADAWDKGDYKDAQYHWEKANELSNGTPLVQNNLAWLLAVVVKPPEYERALALVDSAIQKTDNPAFHSTKGHILNKMERYREALPELEKAKTYYANNPKQSAQLFEALANVCDHLDMKEEAKRYREHFEKAKDQMKRVAGPAQGGVSGPAGPVAPADSKAPAAGTTPPKQ